MIPIIIRTIPHSQFPYSLTHPTILNQTPINLTASLDAEKSQALHICFNLTPIKSSTIYASQDSKYPTISPHNFLVTEYRQIDKKSYGFTIRSEHFTSDLISRRRDRIKSSASEEQKAKLEGESRGRKQREKTRVFNLSLQIWLSFESLCLILERESCTEAL